jgi:ligand-binding sensor domain-containing protein
VPYTTSDGLDQDRVDCVAYDWNTGILWCVTGGGVNIRMPGGDQWRQILFEDIGIRDASALGVGRQFVWLQSGSDYFKTGHTGDVFSRASVSEADADDVRWQGGGRGASPSPFPQLFMDNAFIFDPDGTILSNDLRRYPVVDSIGDAFRNLWIATLGLGMGWANLNTQRLAMLSYGLFMPDVRSMDWDEEGMWIGGQADPSMEGGITFWNTNTGEWTYYESRYATGLRSDQVTSIVTDTDCVWFGTLNGIVRYDKRQRTWSGFGAHQNLWSDEVNILAAGDSTLWVGTAYGLNRIRLPGLIVEKVRNPRLDGRAVFDLEDDGESLWAATDRGAVRYLHGRNTWETLRGYGGMLRNEAWAVSVWNDEVWFATDGGIEVLDKRSGEWRGFPKNQYPTAGPVNVLLADSEVVWAGTDEGVLKYLKSENRWRRFGVEDGLFDDAVRWILPDGDHVWFGTAKGLTRFYWNAPYRRD